MLRRKSRKKAGKAGSKPKKADAPRPRRWFGGGGEGGSRRRRLVPRLAAVAAAVVAVGVCLKLLEQSVLQGAPGAPERIQVRLAAVPDWMPAGLARQVAASLLPGSTSFRDHALTAEVHRRAEASPWIGRVDRVSKQMTDDPAVGLVDIDAAFRRPIARVNVNGRDEYFDAEGWRLPPEQVPQWVVTRSAAPSGGEEAEGRDPADPHLPKDLEQVCFIDRSEVPPGAPARRIHYITIAGIDRSAHPLGPVGTRWDAPDLLEGLKLAQLLCTRRYANQISLVDVRNHAGRISTGEPHLRMYAQVGRGRATDIRFGRFPMPGGDYVVSPARKIGYLDAYYEDHDGRLAGLNSYIDLRYDQLHVSLH